MDISNAARRYWRNTGGRRADLMGLVAATSSSAIYSLHLAFRESRSFDLVWDLGVQNAVLGFLACGVLRRWWIVRSHGRPVLLMGCALASYALGTFVHSVYVWQMGDAPGLSIADIGFVGSYVFVAASVAAAVRASRIRVRLSTVLDLGLGATGAATVTAIALGPVIHARSAHGQSWTTVLVGTAYPFLDIVIVALAVTLAMAPSVRGDFRWSMVTAGMLVFAVADVVYGHQTLTNTYSIGTPLDALWVIGCTLIMWATWLPGPRVDPERSKGSLAQILPASAAATVLFVLLDPEEAPIGSAARWLAAIILVLVVVRSVVAQRDLRRLVDAEAAALTDPLTGLYNRRHAGEALSVMLQVLPRGNALFIAVIDLDDFKHINDSYGHSTGDRALVQLAEAMRTTSRVSDLTARTGGDEFLFASILDQTSAADPARFAAIFRERLLANVNRHTALPVRIDLSLGYAVAPDDGQTIAGLMQLADSRMYVQKSAHHAVFGERI